MDDRMIELDLLRPRVIVQRATRVLVICVLAGLTMMMSACQDNSAVSISEQEYRALLPLSQVKSSYYTEPETHSRYPLIQGSITNLGPETLVVVEFTLRFKDSLQRVIYEEHAYPVFVSKFAAVAAPSEALSPGQKTRFGFKAPNCPPGWQPGNVDIRITKVVFAKRA